MNNAKNFKVTKRILDEIEDLYNDEKPSNVCLEVINGKTHIYSAENTTIMNFSEIWLFLIVNVVN